MGSVEVEALRSFLAVVDEGHFGAAADVLGVPQPTLSRRVQRLEATVGSALLVRNARPVVTTQAGELLAGHARTIVGAADAAVAGLQRLAAGQGRVARIGYVQSATFGWIGKLVAAAAGSGIELELIADPGIRQLESLRSRQLDGGLIRLDSIHHDLTGLEHHELSRDPLYAICREDSELPADEIDRRSLDGHRLILYPAAEGPGLRQLVQSWLRARPRPGLTTEAWDASTAVALAAAGLGTAILPGPLPPLPPGARAVPLADSPLLTLALVWHPRQDATARRIRDALVADGMGDWRRV